MIDKEGLIFKKDEFKKVSDSLSLVDVVDGESEVQEVAKKCHW
jgi:hypothetical protein